MGQMCCNCGNWEKRGTRYDRTGHGAVIIDSVGACLDNDFQRDEVPIARRPAFTQAGQTCREWKPICAETEPPYMGNSGMSIEDVESIGRIG